MFPAPHDALPLPAHPSLDQYRKLAKELLRIAKFGDESALATWAKSWVANLVRLSALTLTGEMPVRIEWWIAQVEQFARITLAGASSKPPTLARAQFVFARLQGFASWPEFAKHLDGLAHSGTATSSFESAADAIVEGDAESVSRMLRENLSLARARSTREHRATLLHYVAANGIEGWRQRTAKNAVEIAGILLDAGAEVDAAADIYGGGATTLGLVATSVHPDRAGVQIALLQLLLDRGARIDRPGIAGSAHSLIKACFANGRGQAAEFLSHHVPALDLEEAAGAGHLDGVRSFFNPDGTLKASATQEQLRYGLFWACQFGRNRVVEYLLSLGFDLGMHDGNGQTALHHAVIGAQLETVRLLLKHGAPLEVKNGYGGTVLGQAVWSTTNAASPKAWLPIIELLLESGAKVEAEFEDVLAGLMRRDPRKPG
ncbi:MAG TPA: ankyrin repeat domain-containing protein [Terracidiphilus sp.]|nr:ankyrin repeat domain-containing protein [Terracidiphilus sp.]